MAKVFFALIFGALLISSMPLVFGVNPEGIPHEKLVAKIKTTSGIIYMQFFPGDAPNHVDNFLTLAHDRYYDGTAFHRIIPGFMIQGGDPNTKKDSGVSDSEWGMGGPDIFLDAEFNTLKHNRGMVSMARSADPDSAGSQFFIVHQDSNFLDGQYTVFGRIVGEESFVTLDRIAELDTVENDKPKNIEQSRIKKISVLLLESIYELNESVLPSPERMKSSSSIMQTSEGQLFKSEQLGVQFTVPQGWLLQQPPKQNMNSPDVVAVGPQTGSIPPAITLTIKEYSEETTFREIITDKVHSLEKMVDEGILAIKSPAADVISNINGRDAHELFLEGYFERDGEKFSVSFYEVMIYDHALLGGGKTYTFSVMNEDAVAFVENINDLNDTIKSFDTYSATTQTSTTTTTPESSPEGGGCLIATAAYGSEMAPQVQFLREIRDDKVMSTQSGTAFMTGFNQFYYSFSPAIADYERENPIFKEAVKLSLTPMLTSLALLNYVDIDTEQEMLGYGIGLILLNIGMYFVAPAAVIIAIKNRKSNFYQTSSTSSNSL